MKKFGIVLGAAAIATLSGCKDPDYKYGNGSVAQNEVKNADVVTIAPAATPKCQCLPGTKHTEPCRCGDPNCTCIVEAKPVITVSETPKVETKPLPIAPVTPVVAPSAGAADAECTTYIVQNGDCLSNISKKYNVPLSTIKRLNPSIKDTNVIRVGQKLKLPGKVKVGAQKSPSTVPAKATGKVPSKKAYAPYSGATKEYVVKSGDTLGSIAYGNGITIRQLKELNGLSKDTIRVGQKLKIPSEKVVKAEKKADAAVASAAAKEAVAPKSDESAPEEKNEVAPAEKAAEADATEVPAGAKGAKADAPALSTYVVQQGDDITGVSIRWGVSAAEIRELNNLSDTDQLVPGQVIKLPAEAQQ